MWVRLAISLLAANASAPSYAPVMPFFLQFGRDGFQSFQAAFADFCKQVLQGFVVFVKVQADNVDGAAAPSDGYFHTVDKGEAEGIGFGACFGKSAGVVVVGQGEQGATVLTGESDNFGWGQHAV